MTNSLLRQKIGIPIGIDPVPFWGNLFLNTNENEYMSKLISNDKVKTRQFHASDLGSVNDESVFSDVYKSVILQRHLPP